MKTSTQIFIAMLLLCYINDASGTTHPGKLIMLDRAVRIDHKSVSLLGQVGQNSSLVLILLRPVFDWANLFVRADKKYRQQSYLFAANFFAAQSHLWISDFASRRAIKLAKWKNGLYVGVELQLTPKTPIVFS